MVRVSSLTKCYPGEKRPAVHDISFTVQPGEMLCLVGNSGCGKTTLLKVINIGTVTLAACIGAGGLGELIITGISLNNNGMILQGALPAATLAIAIDCLLMRLGKRLSPGQ